MRPEPSPWNESSIIPKLLTTLVSVVCRAPHVVLLLALGVAGLSAHAALTHLRYRTQRTDLVSPDKDYQQRWQHYLAEFGDEDDIVVVVQGQQRDRMEHALETIAARIGEHPKLFDRLFYKVDLRSLRDRALLYLPQEQIEQIRDNLRDMGLLLELGPLSWRALNLLTLLREARQRAGQIAPDQPLSERDAQYLSQLLSISQTTANHLQDPETYRNPWSSLVEQPPEQKDLLAEPQYFFSGDGSLAFLLVRPIKEADSFTAARQSVERMRAIIAEVRPDFPRLDIGLTGLPVLETDEMVAAERDTKLASILALIGVTLLYFLVYRGIAYPLLTVSTLMIGTLWALGWTTWTVGHLNILSATFAVMLIGMGDYGVLWATRYEQERRAGHDVRAALRRTAVQVAVGNLTAAATLALAFYAAMLADFQAVAELGWIAGSGVLFCALACFTVLPALLMICDRRGDLLPGSGLRVVHDQERYLAHATQPTAAAWLPRLTARPVWVVGLTVVVVAALAVWASRVRYDHNLLNLQARDLDSVKWEMTLIEHTAGASWHALSYRPTPEETLALKSRFEKLPEVSQVVEVASLIPRDGERKIELLRDIRQRLDKLPPRGATIPHAQPNPRDLQTELACLIGQLKPLAAASPTPLLTELHDSLCVLRQQLTGMAEAPWTAPRLLQFDERLAGDLAEDLHRLRDVSNPAPITLDDLPTALRERYIGATGQFLLQVFGKDCLWEFEPLQHFTQQIHKVDPEATGKPFATVEGLTAMKSGFEWAGLYALLAIAAVLLADFRQVGTTLLALTPLALGVIMTLGIMVVCDVPLNPANMIAFPLILGVGVDNGVHVLHDFRLRQAEGHVTISKPLGWGVLIKALTSIIGFGMLMISTQRGLVSLGFILALGVACCMVTALVFLPCLLRLLAELPRSKGKVKELDVPPVRPWRPAA
ncbi:MAG: MMPL family transporter [Gemmataceae bacterium]